MLRVIIKFITDRLVARCERLGRVHYITGGANGKTVYLVRYIVFKSRFGCIFVHRFLRSDADNPHDHPWNFFTYVIEGGYKEVYYDKTKPQTEWYRKNPAEWNDHLDFSKLWTEAINLRLPGSLAYRRATDVHKVVVGQQLELEYDPTIKLSQDDKDTISNAPYTICIIGKRKRDWGFWDQQGKVFTDWREYLNIIPGDPRVEGSE